MKMPEYEPEGEAAPPRDELLWVLQNGKEYGTGWDEEEVEYTAREQFYVQFRMKTAQGQEEEISAGVQALVWKDVQGNAENFPVKIIYEPAGEEEWIGSFSFSSPKEIFWFTLEGEEFLYTSPKWTLDQDAPKAQILLEGESCPAQGYIARPGQVELEIQIEEDDVDWEETQAVLEFCPGEGEETRREILELKPAEGYPGLWEARRLLEEEGTYLAEVKAQDLAGNKEVGRAAVMIDRTPPAGFIQEITADGQQILPDRMNGEDRYYIRQDAQICIQLADTRTGIQRAQLYFCEDGTQERILLAELEEMKEIGQGTAVLRGTVPASGTGWIGLWAEDECGNSVGSREDPEALCSIIGEREDRHEQESGAVIEAEEADGENGYYTGDVVLHVRLWDNVCGIRRMTVTGNGETLYSYTKSGKDLPEEKICSDIRLVVPDEYEGALSVRAVGWDMAGNQIEAARELLADTKPPRGEVIWEEADAGGIFWNYPRRAKLRVEDAYFSAEDSPLTWRGMEAGPWVQTGDGAFEAELLFREDGTYTPSFSCADKAGNRCVVSGDGKFIIDQTPPLIQVTTEQEPANGKYYREPPVFAVEITESYPKEEAFVWTLVREGKKEGWEPREEISWSGNKGRAAVRLEEEGQYQWELQAADMAGNVSKTYVSPEIIVDMTPPDFSWEGFEPFGSYRGDFAPAVTVSDIHLEKESLSADLAVFGSDGLHLPYEVKERENCLRMEYAAWPRVQEMDGRYRLELSARDLAGNEVSRIFLFTVNRFGSRFTVNNAGKDMEDRYYVDQMPLWNVTEQNVSPVTEHKVLVSRDGKLQAWTENEQYTVTRGASEFGYREYVYRFFEDAAEKDGAYRVKIQTKDAAGNENEMEEVKFFLDTEPPSVIVSGVENGGAYEETERDIYVDVQDSSGTRELMLRLNGKTMGRYDREAIEEADGVFRLHVQGITGDCALVVTAEDLAGNRTAEETVRFMLGTKGKDQSDHPEQLKERDSADTAEEGRAGERMNEEEHTVFRAWTGAVFFAVLCGMACIGTILWKNRRSHQRAENARQSKRGGT